MTTPHLSNCPHSPAGWCLACVGRLNARLDGALDALFQIEQVGHNPADLAPDLTPTEQGETAMAEANWKLALRLAGMANDALARDSKSPGTVWTHDLKSGDLDAVLLRLRRCDGRESDAAVIVWEQCQALADEFDRLRSVARTAS